jgi:hypothetical protein
MLTCALTLALLLGQATASAPSGRVGGVVVEEGTSTPVSSARVTLSDGRPPQPQAGSPVGPAPIGTADSHSRGSSQAAT